MEELELHRCEEPAALCPLRTETVLDNAAQEALRRCLDIRTADAAMTRLGVCVTHSDDMMTLRGLVRDEPLPLSRIGNHQVIEHAATLVATRQLCVVIRPAFFEARSSEPARAMVKTSSQYRPQSPRLSPQSRPNILRL